MSSMCCPAPATSTAEHGPCLQDFSRIPLRLTDDVGLVLEISLRVLPALDVLLAVPPVDLLADLLPALLVDALRIPDGGSAAG